MKKVIYLISDGTGISVETVTKSLLTQFTEVKFNPYVYRYINTIEKINVVIASINNQNHTPRPIIISTIADKLIRDQLYKADACCIDIFGYLLEPLEKELNMKSSGFVGLSHAILNDKEYDNKIDALNFTISNDDGVITNNFDKSSIVILGVSRSGKTPTCLYLALHYGLFAANYPLTEENFTYLSLPSSVESCKDKLFGLTISAERLHSIRQERLANSKYSSLKQCQYEVDQAVRLYDKYNINYLNTTYLSIEELSTQIIQVIN